MSFVALRPFTVSNRHRPAKPRQTSRNRTGTFFAGGPLIAGVEPAPTVFRHGRSRLKLYQLSYTNKNGSSPHSNGEGRSPACDLGAQLPFLLAIRFVDHPAHKAAHQTPQGYAPKLSESASESSGVPLVARLRRWLLRRGLNDFGRQAVPRVDATKPRQWLQKLLSEIPSQFDELVDITKPCRWLMNLVLSSWALVQSVVDITKPCRWLMKLGLTRPLSARATSQIPSLYDG